jgi:hypothetical protein
MPFITPSEYSFIAAFTSSFEVFPAQQGSEIHDGHGWRGHAKGQTAELALQLGDDEADSPRSPRLARHDVHRSCARVAQIFGRQIQQALRIDI